MERYLVGGAVRDALLGLEVKDRDWVIVGADPDALLAEGYLPVGRDFPVVQGFVIFATFVFVSINLCVDLLYGWIDPRIRIVA